MKFSKDSKYYPIVTASIITVAVCALIVLAAVNIGKLPDLLSSVLAIISPFIYGFFIAYICNPIMKLFETKVFKFGEKGKKFSRPLSLTCAVIVLLLFVTLIFVIVIPQITNSYNELSDNFNIYIAKAQSLADDFVRNFRLFNGRYENLSDFLNASEIASDLKDLIGKAGTLLTTVADYILTHALNFVVEIKNIIMGVIISVYFLLSKDRLSAQIKKILASVLSRRKYLNAVNLGRFANRTVGGFISGKILDSIIIGLLSFIVFTIFGLPYTPLISVVVGVTNIIPFFGPFIGAIPSAFIILIAEPSKTILFIILILIIQQLDGNVIGPMILGDSTGLSALSVLIAISIGGGLFGLVGMFLGVPAYAVIREIVKQHIDKRLKKRSLPKSLDFYMNDPAEPQSESAPIFLDRDAVVDEPYYDYEADAEEDGAEIAEEEKKSSIALKLVSLVKTMCAKLADLVKRIAARTKKK